MNHVYNAYILKSYHDPALYKTREVFQLNLALFPNWISHLLMAGLMFIVPPLIAEKLLLTLCIVGVPLAFLYFLRSIDPDNTFYAWLGFLFSYHYLLHMGFYNFALSFALFFIVIGYWWRNRHVMTAERIGILYLMLIVLYFCHIVSYALSLAVIAVVACLTLRRLRPVIICAGYMMPAGFLLLNYLLDSTQGQNINMNPVAGSGNISGKTDHYWPSTTIFCGPTWFYWDLLSDWFFIPYGWTNSERESS